MRMLEYVEAFARVGIPNSTAAGISISAFEMKSMPTDAEKSADAVQAMVASLERRACQQAPLWPMKEPILRWSNFDIPRKDSWPSSPVPRHAVS